MHNFTSSPDGNPCTIIEPYVIPSAIVVNENRTLVHHIVAACSCWDCESEGLLAHTFLYCCKAIARVESSPLDSVALSGQPRPNATLQLSENCTTRWDKHIMGLMWREVKGRHRCREWEAYSHTLL